jgi:hypothetical protein
MAKRYKDREDEQHSLPVQKYTISYYDYDAEKRVYWPGANGKPVEFYDEIKAGEFANILHGIEGINPSVEPL